MIFAFMTPAGRQDGVVVPLTPEALDGCREQNLDYRVVDDLIDRRQVLGDADQHLRWQYDWISAVGHALGRPDTCRSTAQLLKIPLDSAVVWGRVLRAVLDTATPASIGYIGPSGPEESDPLHNGHLQFWPVLGDLPLAPRYLRLLARERSIRYEETATPRRQAGGHRMTKQGTQSGPPTYPSFTRDLRARVAPLRNLSAGRPLRSSSRGASLLTWLGGYGIAGIARAERNEGARVLYLQRGGTSTALLGLGLLGYGPVRRPVPFGDVGNPGPLPPEASGLLSQVDEQANVHGAGEILRRRVEVYASLILPLVDKLARGLEPQLVEAGVDRVIATNAWSAEEFAALLAASRSHIERVMYQHGDHAFSYDGWLLTETVNFDRMVASDPTVPADLEDGARRLHLPLPQLSVGLHRRPGRRSGAPTERPACYVPATLTGDTAVVPRMYYEDAWYLRWQLGILAEMAARPATRFIWKALPATNQAEDSIPAAIARLGITNVEYESRPFPQVLPTVGCVVLDFPSTALYEAVSAGAPTVCVSFPRFAQLRRRALDLFQGVLHECGDEAEALTVVRRFLDTPVQQSLGAALTARERLLRQS